MSVVDVTQLYGPSPADDVPSDPPWEAWRVALLSPEEFRGLGGPTGVSTQQLAYLAAFGLLAPTTHNTVPQRFELRERESALRLWLDRRLVLPDSDRSGRQAAVSLGCVIANVELAARCFGLEVDVEVASTPLASLGPAVAGEADLMPVATVRLRAAASAAPAPQDWLELMRRRKMVRAKYDESAELPAAVAEELSSIVEAHAGLRLHLLRDAPSLLFLGKFQELADSTVINRAGFARELGDWLLENDSAAFLGMRGQEFGLSDEAARRFHLGLLGQLELLPDEVAGFAKASNVGMRSASAVGVITVETDDLAHRLAAGRAYQHVALALLRHGFVVAMHAGITEVEAPNMALRGRLRTLWRPEVVFRTGRLRDAADGARPHASRPSLASVLLPSMDAT